MTRIEIFDMLNGFYKKSPEERNVFIGESGKSAHGEIVSEQIFYEIRKQKAIVGDGFTYGVAVVERQADGSLKELAGKCKACPSLFLARKHIKGLKMGYGTWKGRNTQATTKTMKKTDAPRKRGGGLTKIKRSA